MQVTQSNAIKTSETTTRPTQAKAMMQTTAKATEQNWMGKDHVTSLGKSSNVITDINLLDEPSAVNEIVENALSELSHSAAIFPGFEEHTTAVPRSTFAEREAKMRNHLMTKLNECVVSEKDQFIAYKYTDKELCDQVNELKKELKNIATMLRNGVTDCWGGLTNRQVACEAGIKAIEKCLQARTQMRQIGFPRPNCEPMPAYPRFHKI